MIARVVVCVTPRPVLVRVDEGGEEWIVRCATVVSCIGGVQAATMYGVKHVNKGISQILGELEMHVLLVQSLTHAVSSVMNVGV